ncbi:MAG: hypothetical protein GY854_19060 [Deltaproteobacteria bacterium]|nr:hypothetical protein [Deltaproteobacteria bacterium]
MMIRCIVILSLALSVLGLGCAPKIIIRLQDKKYKNVVVKIDDKKVGVLNYGDSLSKKVSKGNHSIDAMPKGSSQCPWTEDGEGWNVYVDEGATLTLLPVEPEPESPQAKEK